MKPILRRILQAYEPMHLRGLMLDGPCMWPKASRREPPGSTLSSGQRMLPALTDTRRHALTAWRKS
ncbi:MAG: hypothetical protein WC617_18895 [Rhodanobacter sp.]